MGRAQAVRVQVLDKRRRDANSIGAGGGKTEMTPRPLSAPRRTTRRCLGNTVTLINTLVLGPLG